MQELMKRSETIERGAWSDLYRRAPRSLRRKLGLRAEEHSGVTFLSAAGADHLLLNRAIGLGGSPATHEAAATAAVRYYQRRKVRRYWIHLGSQLRYSQIPGHLQAQGVVPYPRSWMKFVRRAGPVGAVKCDLDIRRARPEDASRVAEIVAPSFELPREAAQIFTTAIDAQGWHYFVAEDEGRVAAAAALYARGSDALLVFAATAPEARGHGCHRALMAARLEQARALGCDHVFTETGLPVEGKPGPSYRNILRAGFDELYVRDNFAPEGTRWQNHPSSDATERSSVSPRPSRRLPKAVAPSGT